ncbi:MAG: hypothetical protein Q4Q20_02395 [Methanocorpusculum sp.]|nr:hypothetical protein [Methanocorpusculum sp.]
MFRIPYFLLSPKTTAAHPSPASIPINGTGLFPAGVSLATGFTEGTSGVCVTVGVGVGISVGVGVAVSQMEEPCVELLLSFAYKKIII